MHVIWMCMRFWTTFLDPHVPKTRFFTIDFNDFWTPSRAHFVPPRGQKIKGLFRPITLSSASDFIKRLKNVKLSSKSGFSPQNFQTDLKILTWNGSKTWNCRPNPVLALKSFETYLELFCSIRAVMRYPRPAAIDRYPNKHSWLHSKIL